MSTYFIYYLFGWFLYQCKGEVSRFEKDSLTHVVMGLGLFLILCRIDAISGFRELAMISTLSALSVWCLIFAGMGLFLKFLNGHSRTFSYLADSSYWLYMMHLPVIVWLVVALKGFDLPSPVKATLVLSLTTALLLGTYEFSVRRTFIGRFLSGR